MAKFYFVGPGSWRLYWTRNGCAAGRTLDVNAKCKIKTQFCMETQLGQYIFPWPD